MLHPGESRYADETDRQTDREAVTLRFPLEAASVIIRLVVTVAQTVYDRTH